MHHSITWRSPADALDVYVFDDLVVEEERMVEEEREGYAAATLSQDESRGKVTILYNSFIE